MKIDFNQLVKNKKAQTTFVLLLVILGLLVYTLTARAATRTWDGGGGDNNWSTCANWSSDTCPTSADLALFDGTSDKDATIDGSFVGSVLGLQITSNYDGIITQSRDLTFGGSDITIAGGTFNQGTYAFLRSGNSAAFSLSGGTFNSGVGTSTFSGDFSLTGGTYSVDANRVVHFNGLSSSNITCTGTLGGKFDSNKSSGATATVNAGCTVNTVNTVASGGNITANGTINFNGSPVMDTLTIGSSGIVNYSGTSLTIEGTLNITSGTFNVDPDLVTTFNGTGSGSISCSGTLPGTINMAKGTGAALTIGSGCTVATIDNDVTSAALTVNGTITFSGTTIDLRSLTINAGGVVNYSGATTTFDTSYSKDAAGTFNSTSVLQFDSSNSGSISCSETLANLIYISKGSGVAFTLGAGCTAQLSQNVSNSHNATINGTLVLNGKSYSASSVAISSTGTLRLLGSETTVTTPTLATGSTVDYNGTGSYSSLKLGNVYSNLKISGSGSWDIPATVEAGDTFTQTAGTFETANMRMDNFVLSGGTFVAPAGTLIVEGDFNHSAGTFTHNSGEVQFGSGSHTLTTAASTVFYDVTLTDTSLHAYWKFDEASGSSATDSSGNGFTGTLVAMEAGDWSTSDKATLNFTNAAALNVNANGEYISVNLDLSSAWTIAAWFKWPLNSATSYNTLIRGTSDHQILVRRSDNLLGYYDNVGGSNFNSSGYDMDALSNGWHHVAAVGVSTTTATRFYIDGVLVGSASRKSTQDVLTLGNYSGTADQPWGFMDDFRIYSRDLTGAEVNTLAAGDEITAVGGTVTLAGDTLDVANDLTIAVGTLDVSATGCSGGPCGIEVGGDWSNAGTFTPRTGTVTFDGTNQQILGTTAFYHLTKNVGSAATLTFEAGETQTIDGTLTLTGSGTGARLSLVSGTPTSQYYIAPEGSRSLNYLSITDANNTSGTDIICYGSVDCTNGGNNTAILFEPPPAPEPKTQLNGGLRLGGIRLQ